MATKVRKGESAGSARKASRKTVIYFSLKGPSKGGVELVDKGDLDALGYVVTSRDGMPGCEFLCGGGCGCLYSGCKAPCSAYKG